MLDPGGQWVDGMQRSRVLRVYLFTKRSAVSPNISDDKQGFAKYLWKKLPVICDNKHLLVFNIAELLPNICENHYLVSVGSQSSLDCDHSFLDWIFSVTWTSLHTHQERRNWSLRTDNTAFRLVHIRWSLSRDVKFLREILCPWIIQYTNLGHSSLDCFSYRQCLTTTHLLKRPRFLNSWIM